MSASSPIVRHLAALLSFGAMSVGMTWPLALHLDTHVARAKWHYDSMVNLMILGSRMHYALGIGSLESIYDNYFCAPVPLSIANNESLFGLSLLYAPYYLATRDPLLSYNLLLLTCLTLSGLFTYLLVRRLGGSSLAGVVCGAAFAYSPYVFFELGRIQLVATQWLPLCALLLHDAVETGRWRSVVGLFLAFAMQVGSCMYYAMFLAVYFATMGPWLMLRHRRFTPNFIGKLAAGSVLGAALVVPMIYPHVTARQDFPLTRSMGRADAYSGRAEHLWQVYPENKTLGFLHDNAGGPYEPIAFPGFVMLSLALLALAVPIASRLRAARTRDERQRVVTGVALGLLAFLAAGGAGLMGGHLALGVPVFLGVIWLWRTIRSEPLLPAERSAYLLFLVFIFALFLGPVAAKMGQDGVDGLYLYLYEHVPGFDGIRYVSRFAILIMLGLTILAGWGGTWLLNAFAQPRLRAVAFAVLLALVLVELRNAPISLAEIPNRRELSPAYLWLAQHTGPEPLAIMPAYPKGRHGARNDYISLFHRRRTINGKSSWMPPITHYYIRESRRFPRRTGTRLLKTLGVKYLLVHSEEYSDRRALRIRDWIAGQKRNYELVFSSGDHYVYEVVGDRTGMNLLETPPLPSGLKRIPRLAMRANAGRYPTDAALAFDGKPETRWATRRDQLPGDWFEVHLKHEVQLAGFEMRDFDGPFDSPMAYRVTVAGNDGQYTEVVEQGDIVIHQDQVYRPKSFVFRALFDQPVTTRSLRIELLDNAPGSWWSIHEMDLWAK